MEPARDRFAPHAEVIFADRFRLIREIGRGGMATVWLAHHLGLDSPCAIKFVGETFSHPSARQRFEREAKAAARLRSPHVVQVFDCGVWGDVPYIAMEYLEGEDLSTRLGRLGRLGPEAAFQIAAQIARALSKAHAEMVVHRDLKPANVFLVREDGREIVKVLDFGIAKIIQTATGTTLHEPGLVGTPQYMSPEQAHGRLPVDHRTDLWALAVIVFQCLTGVNPFAAEDVTPCLMRIVHDPIPPPSLYPVGLPPALDGWWARAVARERDDRFPDAKSMIAALAGALGFEYQDRSSDVLGSTTVRRMSTSAIDSLPTHLAPAPTVLVRRRRSPALVILAAAAITAAALLVRERLGSRRAPTASAAVHAAATEPLAPVAAPARLPPREDLRPATAASNSGPVRALPELREGTPQSPPARRPGQKRHKDRSPKVDLGF
jgi:serine/threonine protein kinase